MCVCVLSGEGIGVLKVFFKFLPSLTLAALAKGSLLHDPLLGLKLSVQRRAAQSGPRGYLTPV